MKWDGPVVKDKHAYGSQVGDIVKIVGKALSTENNFKLQAFVSETKKSSKAKPFIAINTGYEGQLSRILNGTFSPVTHPLLTVKAAPGQLSFKQVQNALHLMGMLPPKRFYLFGTPIQASPSPTLHHTGFTTLGLPHTYDLFETPEVDDQIKQLVKNADFGGASVTIPHKLAIIPLLDELTPAARAIGAVNTVIARTAADGSRTLIGDNTDWLGIRNCVSARLSIDAPAPTTGLVIGAGGTSRAAIYALHRLGVQRIYLYNRTRSSAETLAGAFPEEFNIEIVDSVAAFPNDPPTIIISTVPGAATAAAAASKEVDGSSLLLTSALFQTESGVAVDMAYRPAVTALLTLASEKKGWRIVRGVDVLLEQGYAQFALWTGRQCPRSVVSGKVWEKFNQA